MASSSAALVVASGMHEQRWAGPLEDRTLTLRRRKDSRFIDPGQQVRVKKADRLRIVKMAPVVAPPPADDATKGAST